MLCLLLPCVATAVRVDGQTSRIERPYYTSPLVQDAVFDPNVMTSDARELPPLYVRTDGSAQSVTAFVTNNKRVQSAYELNDDGVAGDLVAADGIFTLTGVPFAVEEYMDGGVLAFGDFDDFLLKMFYRVTNEDGTEVFNRAQLGIVSPQGLFAAMQIGDGIYRSEYVVNMVDDGTLIDPEARTGIDLEKVSERFYAHFDDAFDFVVVRPSLDLGVGLHGLHSHMRNQITGIGVSTHLWGGFDTPENLQSMLFINFNLIGPVVHELAHRWANHLELFDEELHRGHFSFTDGGGILGGNATTFADLGDGRYSIGGLPLTSFWGGRYSDLELYLMGLVPAAEVAPRRILRGAEFIDYDSEKTEYIATGNEVQTVTIDDIIAAEGPRVPDFSESQKSFRMATIVVSPEELAPAALAYFDRQARFLGSDADHDLAFAAATGYRASLDTWLGPIVTAVLGQQEAASQPVSMQLAQNFPNPFNSSTTIPFTLPASTDVELAVFNLTGQQVATLVNGNRKAGAYTVHWDGRDDDGRELASGVYLYRLQTGEGTPVKTRKLVLME